MYTITSHVYTVKTKKHSISIVISTRNQVFLTYSVLLANFTLNQSINSPIKLSNLKMIADLRTLIGIFTIFKLYCNF